MLGLPRSGTTWMQELLIANFDCGVCIQFKHSRADAACGRKLAPELLAGEGGVSFAEAIVARDAVAVVMKKRFSDWWESIHKPPKGIFPAVLRICGEETLKSEDASREMHEKYYEEWAVYEKSYPYNFLLLRYERALGEIEQVLLELVDKYQVPPKKETWDLLATWKPSNPRREKYLEGTEWQTAKT